MWPAAAEQHRADDLLPGRKPVGVCARDAPAGHLDLGVADGALDLRRRTGGGGPGALEVQVGLDLGPEMRLAAFRGPARRASALRGRLCCLDLGLWPFAAARRCSKALCFLCEALGCVVGVIGTGLGMLVVR